MNSVDEAELTRHFIDLRNKPYGYDGVCYRAVWKEYADQHCLIHASGSFITGGRYNEEAKFGVLYLSCDPKTSIDEAVQSINASPSEMAESLPKMIAGLKVKLAKVLRLTREDVLSLTNLRKVDLVDLDWVSKQMRNEEIVTQIIGKAARAAGYEAILVPSARRDGCNLNIFLDNLAPDSSVTLVNVNRLCSTTLMYEEACGNSIAVISNRIRRSLTSQETKTLFVPKDQVFY